MNTSTKFTKQQILNSKTYRRNKDLLSALLDENKTYSHSEITKILENIKGVK